MENPFNITREEILDLAARKLLEQLDADSDSVDSIVRKEVSRRVSESVTANLNAKIDKVLGEEMEKILSSNVVPINIWGDSVGKPTTIRDQLSQKACIYWNELVDNDGRLTSYGGKPRSQWLFQKITNEEFTKAIQQNITNVVGAFKDALQIDSAKMVTAHINSLINVKTSKS